MQHLLQQQHKLKRSKFINNFTMFVHTYILPPMGASLAMSFLEEDKIATLLGLSILFYTFSIGMFIVLPFCLDRKEVFDKKLIEVDKNIKQVEQIHFSLDLLRNAMLFDEDKSYWQTIEKLPVVFDELD